MDFGKIIQRFLMFSKCSNHWITGLGLALNWASLSHAAVTLDGTLSRSGALQGPDYTITADLGRQVGGNLFHSFGQFSISAGEIATFSGPNSVINIIGRVTGGQISLIDGTLRSTIPGANLYLLNPAGVLFGENASLDVSGSVHVSTADYLRLSDGGRFDARTPANSILTVAPVAAFGFLGEAPASITVNGGFLRVPEGQTLSLIGGDLSLRDATLYAPAGRINLVSIGSMGEVIPTETDLTMNGFGRLGAISIERTMVERHRIGNEELGDVDTSGQGGGAIFIRGGQWVSRGGGIFANTYGNQKGRGVDVVLSGGAQLEGETLLRAATFGTGDAGSVTLHVNNLELSGGGQISAGTYGGGHSGNITIIARDVVISGTGLTENVFSGLFSKSANGDGGSITLDVDRLELSGGGRIVSSTQGIGKGGDITISARDHVTIRGIDSGLFTAAIPGSIGNAGSIILHTDHLGLSGGSTITSGTAGAGSGGDVNIFANTVSLSGGGGIFTGTFGAAGDGGDIVLIARDTVTISGNYSELSANSYESTGDAGNIIVTAPKLILTDGGTIDATSELTSGGNITLNVDHLKLLDGSSISSSVEGDETTTGGNVTINSINVVALNDSSITAQANQGRGGNIIVHADVFLHNAADVNDVLDASSKVKGNDGTVQNNAPTTDISGNLTVLPANYLDVAGQLSHRCGMDDPENRSSFTVQGRGALPPGPDEPATAPTSHCRSESTTVARTAPLVSAPAASPTPFTTNFGDH